MFEAGERETRSLVRSDLSDIRARSDWRRAHQRERERERERESGVPPNRESRDKREASPRRAKSEPALPLLSLSSRIAARLLFSLELTRVHDLPRDGWLISPSPPPTIDR